AGVSHFLEHMVFKGTPRRDALAVNRDLDRIGAKHNAETSEEHTFYHVTCLPEYLPRAFDVLSDILRPSLREEDFETEKQVIIEEIKTRRDPPVAAAAAGPGGAPAAPPPGGRGVGGAVAARGGLPPQEMRVSSARRYGAENLVLAFAGKTDWDQLVALAEAH